MHLRAAGGNLTLSPTQYVSTCGACGGLDEAGAQLRLTVETGREPARVVVCGTCLASAIGVKLAAERARRGGSIAGIGVDDREP